MPGACRRVQRGMSSPSEAHRNKGWCGAACADAAHTTPNGISLDHLRYAHLAPSHKVKAVSVLEESLGQRPNYTKTIQSTKKGVSHNRLTP